MTADKPVAIKDIKNVEDPQIRETFEANLRDSRMPDTVEPYIQEALEDLLNRYSAYAEDDDIEMICRAFAFAYKAHILQIRKAGDPYITHPIATAEILLELEVDKETLVAALLHDTVEDTMVDLPLVKELFGSDVALLVDGVTKLGRISYSSREIAQAENLRKMFLAMARDIRVVLIKLADRLHNMRTLKYKSPDKQYEIAKETKDIYAPLAHRLGIYKIKWELEDLCLRYMDKDAYYELVGAISQKRSDREEFMENVINELYVRIQEQNISVEIEGRPKHFYSIYNKMKTQGKSLEQIFDLFACRVVVETITDCYTVLGMVHDLYYPLPGRFKDYIAMPKPNMYQSLHTTVIGKKGIPFEVQIRTVAMHRTAEYGIAAHWQYKDAGKGKDNSLDVKLSWLRQLLDMQGDSKDAGDFLDILKTSLIAAEVFVFTPKGDVISLPAQSVPIDFAYSIHSGVGNRMFGAKVNGRIVPLTYELQNGDIVEILTSEKVHGPSRDWLKLVKSSEARSKIRSWFIKDMREENVVKGREAFERDVKKTGFTVAQLTKREILEPVLRKHSRANLEDLLAMIGYGGITSQKIVGRLKDEYIRSLSDEKRQELGYRITSGGQIVYGHQEEELTTHDGQAASEGGKAIKGRDKNAFGVKIKGIDNGLVHLSRCCSPVPGDPIVGYVTRGTGVGVHRADCANILNIRKNADNSVKSQERLSRLIEVEWRGKGEDKSYPVEMYILARDRRRLLADISDTIANEAVYIHNSRSKSNRNVTASIYMTIDVKNQAHFDRVADKIRSISGILDVRRGH